MNAGYVAALAVIWVVLGIGGGGYAGVCLQRRNWPHAALGVMAMCIGIAAGLAAGI